MFIEVTSNVVFVLILQDFMLTFSDKEEAKIFKTAIEEKLSKIKERRRRAKGETTFTVSSNPSLHKLLHYQVNTE